MWSHIAINAIKVLYYVGMQEFIAEEFRDMPASFGPEIAPDGLRGFLVVGEPEDGCGPMAKPPTVENFTGKWIVLVSRFNCSFEVKVRNAQAAGFNCAIVHNVNSSELETMSAKDPVGIDIPSVFVSDLAGQILSEEYIYINKFYIMVNGDLPFDINTHLLLPFAIVVVLCLIVILIFMIVKCIKDRRRARRHRLPNRSLKKIPICKFSKGDPYDTCAICLDDYQEGDKLRVLPCAHAYHSKCIDPWLTQNRRVCPVCKRRVVAAGERVRARPPHSGSDSSDTEPLLDSQPQTQGGTFVAQRENPFMRAARYIATLRRSEGRATTGDAEAPHSTAAGADINEETEGDHEPLIQNPERAIPERRRRRQRARPPADRSTTDPQTPEFATPRGSAEQPLHPDAPSINEANGEIGVAALPARPEDPDHHINL
ncbi:E3 ubiquitin-protein ligase RNF13-like isoform X2 [Leptidea sinapis]|uniref:E3 ubiquitin-protein ligase RNF13-like isoform X2 n=1 Tax=Leptidea sinapis TaxID=189913 RepID=UPI0021349051|nr:E3 ubiquitin-protein ligase RNF13-like isoform X2 [Leptidea sinapis]